MTSKTVFDAAHQTIPLLSLPAFGLIGIAIGGLLLWRGDAIKEALPESRNDIGPQAIRAIFLIFSVF